MTTISGAGAHASVAGSDRAPFSKAGTKGYHTVDAIKSYIESGRPRLTTATGAGSASANTTAINADVSAASGAPIYFGEASYAANTLTVTGARLDWRGKVIVDYGLTAGYGIDPADLADATAMTWSDGTERFAQSFRNSKHSGNSIYKSSFPDITAHFDVLQGVLHIPAGTTIHHSAAVAGYVRSDCAVSGSPSGPNGVGGFFTHVSAANGAATWGINTLGTDNETRLVSAGAGTGRILIGGEFDFNIMHTASQAIGVSVGGNSIAQPTNALGFVVNTLGNGNKWTTGFYVQDGTTTYALAIGANATSGSDVASQPALWQYFNGSSVKKNYTVVVTAAQIFSIANDEAASVLRVGAAGSSQGSLDLCGVTSGVVSLKAQAAAGTYNFNLPAGAGTAGQPLLSGGGGSTAMTFGTLGVAAGGTGATTVVGAYDAISAKGADIASASTTDIGAATGAYVEVTGTTTITALGTAAAGVHRTVRFTGSLTLTHNATSLITLSGRNFVTFAGDVAEFVSLGSGNWRMIAYRSTGSNAGFFNADAASEIDWIVGGTRRWKYRSDGHVIALGDYSVWAGNGSTSVAGHGFKDEINSGLYRIGTGNLGITCNGTKAMDITAATVIFSGAVVSTPGGSLTLGANGQLGLEFTSNTSVTVKGRGSDGTTRSVVLTLA